MLFNILLGHLEVMEREKFGEGRVYILVYADDIVLMTEGKDKMKNMIGRLEKYRKKS